MNNVITSFISCSNLQKSFTEQQGGPENTSDEECSALDATPGRRSAVRMGLQSTDAVVSESSIFTGIFVNIPSLSLLTYNILRPKNNRVLQAVKTQIPYHWAKPALTSYLLNFP
jgi:hypothetical protein